MPDHTLIIRIATDATFRPSQTALRSIIADSLIAWPRDGFRLISISPLPRDRYIKPRKSPTHNDYPLLRYLEEK